MSKSDGLKQSKLQRVFKKKYWTLVRFFKNGIFSNGKSANKQNAVFIWIPKTGGMSLYHMLGQPPKHKTQKSIKENFTQSGLVTFGHIDYYKLVSKGIICTEYNSSSFKFTICRNPFDRAVSLYTYLKGIHNNTTFLDFCHRIQQGVPPIGLYNRRGLSQCNLQMSWVKNLKIDYTIRFEDYQTYSKELFKRLDIPWAGVAHLNASKHAPWQEYYCEESEYIISDVYGEDFEYFGYSRKII